MLKKEVKRMEWGIPEVQPDQRTEAKYLLGIVDDVDDWDGKSVKPVEPKEEPKEEPKVEEEEDEEEEVVETPKKK